METNSWAVVLGGSSGLGLASAIALAREGLNICVVHRSRKSDLLNLEQALSEMEGLGVRALAINKDAMKPETREHVLELLPKRSVKVLLHSIAKGTVKPLQALTYEDFSITLEAMAISWWQWAHAFVENEKFETVAHNLAFTSEGNSRVWKGYGAVSVAKAALEALMRQMAIEYGSLGIRTNCIQAGVTDTPSLRHIPGYERLLQAAEKRNPLSQITTPEMVGNVVVQLCKPASQWINGTVIKADGGESLQ